MTNYLLVEKKREVLQVLLSTMVSNRTYISLWEENTLAAIDCNDYYFIFVLSLLAKAYWSYDLHLA